MVDLDDLLSITYLRPDLRSLKNEKLYPSFRLLYSSLNWSTRPNNKNDNDMVLLVTNILNKYGFMNMAIDRIKEINGSLPTTTHVFIQYELNNFIIYTKSTLDAIAIVLNHVYQLGRSKGDIDLKWSRFSQELIHKSPNSLIAARIISKKDWIEEVVTWRDEVNHRTFSLIGQVDDPKITDDHKYKMAKEPLNILYHENHQYLIKKYNNDIMQEIEPFCDKWISNCKDLIEVLGEELVQNIQLFKK